MKPAIRRLHTPRFGLPLFAASALLLAGCGGASEEALPVQRPTEVAAIDTPPPDYPFEQPPDPDGTLQDGQRLAIGASTFVVRHTPGHSPGHVVFLGDAVMIGGDLLFAGSIGRTDLPLSDPEAMEQSLALLGTFNPDLVVYPGHGPPTNIATELATNPVLSGSARSTP